MLTIFDSNDLLLLEVNLRVGLEGPVPLLPVAPCGSDPGIPWETAWQRLRQAEVVLKSSIRELVKGMQAGPVRDKVTAWLDILQPACLSLIPMEARQFIPLCTDERYGTVEFVQSNMPQQSDWIDRLPPQQPSPAFMPTEVKHLCFPWVWYERIPQWVEEFIKECQRWLKEVAAGKSTFQRLFSKALILGISCMHPEARKWIWDLRRANEGIITPVKFDQDISAHLNLKFIEKVTRLSGLQTRRT